MTSRLGRAFARVGALVSRRPLAVFVLALVLAAASLGGAAQITSVTGNEAFVEEPPRLRTYQETFDRGAIAVVIKGPVDQPAAMRAIARLDDRLTSARDVALVVSPADDVRREYGRIPDDARAIRAVTGEPRFTLVQVVFDPGLGETEATAVYEDTVAAVEWVQFPAGLQVVVTGEPAFGAQLGELIASSTQTLLGLAIGLIVVALFFLFRGVRLRLLPLVAVFVGVVYTFGAIGYLGIPNSTLTSSVFPILIGLGIDYSVQFHQRYEEELARAPPREALPRAMAGIGPAVLLAMVAAGLGFVATGYNGREVPAVVWFAETSILGIVLSFLTSVVVLLALLTVYERVRPRRRERPDDAERDSAVGGALADSGTRPRGGTIRPLNRRPAREDPDESVVGRLYGQGSRALACHPGPVILVAGLLMLGGFYVTEDVEQLEATEFTPADLPAQVDFNTFQSLTGGGESVRYAVFVSGSELTHPETLAWMERFERVAVGKPTVVDVESPADLVRRYNDGEIPRTTAGVERVLERVPPAERAQYYSDGYAQVTVFAQRDLDTAGTLSFTENVREAIAFSRPPPGVEPTLIGLGVTAARTLTAAIENRNVTTAIGAALVFALLLAYYRSPVKAVAPLVPIAFVVGWQGLYTAALDIPASPLSAALGALTVGIGAEYTIIPMERYFEEKARGASKLDAVEVAARRVGTTITVSGLTTVFGFSALTLSEFPILSDFGVLTVGVIALTLVAALATLPPTLVLLDSVDEYARRRLSRAHVGQ